MLVTTRGQEQESSSFLLVPGALPPSRMEAGGKKKSAWKFLKCFLFVLVWFFFSFEIYDLSSEKLLGGGGVKGERAAF